jgi:DNA polymerase III epsilon subunit-like protein
MDIPKKKMYCSLDIETSGFDPLKNEILEVGFALFEVGEEKKDGGSKIKIIEEYTRVFKPSGPVPGTILGLTGITQQELDEAEPLSMHLEELQEKLKDTVIVGHNVIFDIKFLESVGITFSGEVIDTLDLVQFILPTHHSYNLENLMHIFGVSHKNAHRALADAKASLIVLEKLLEVFRSFPFELQNKIVALGKRFDFTWVQLMELQNVHGKQELTSSEVRLSPSSAASKVEKSPISLTTKTIFNFPVGTNCVEDLTESLLGQKKKILLVIPKISQVMSLWKDGRVEGVFSPRVLFNAEKFEALLAKPEFTIDESRFILKVLVWKYTNWQTQSIFDMNLSFFGGQFRSLITGGELVENKKAKIVCCDLETLTAIQEKKIYGSRFVIIVGLNEFEQYVSSSLSVKASWSYATYILKSFYNPELGTGNVEMKEPVEAGLLKADMFFGLVHALLKSENQTFQYYTLDSQSVESETFKKIQGAAENFALGLLELNKAFKSEQITHFSESITAFFAPDDNYVKWIELAETRCVLFSSPLEIKKAVHGVLEHFPHRAFADSLGSKKLLAYFVQRLGLEEFAVLDWVAGKGESLIQGELFLPHGKELGGGKLRVIACKMQSQVISSEELFAILSNAELPAAVLFGNVTQVKEFYDQYYQTLKERAFLLAQSNSGGSNKMFHNFTIHKNSLLLATGKFILKHLTSSSSIDPVDHVAVKTLIVCNLPFEQYTHPYQQAVSSQFSNPFEEYSLPKAIYNFHALLEFFNTDQLERIYVCDSKLGKGYGSAFRNYVEQIPSLTIESS